MVTQRETRQILIGPGGAFWLIAATIVVGIIAFLIAQAPRSGRFEAYDQLEPNHIIQRDQTLTTAPAPSNPSAIEQPGAKAAKPL